MANTLLSVAAKSATGEHSSAHRVVDRLPLMRTNVSSSERWASLLAGSALLGYGISARSGSLLSSLAGGYLIFRAMTGHCPGYQAMGVSMSDATAENSVIAAGHGTKVEETITIARPVNEIYQFWRDFENLPKFMTHLLDVDTTTDGQSHWVAQGPLGLRVEWDAELITDTPNEVIAWRSLQGSDVDTAGSVHFRTVGAGQTEIRVILKYDPPAGKLGTAVAKLVGQEPKQQVREDLQRLKMLLESPTSPTVIVGQGHANSV